MKAVARKKPTKKPVTQQPPPPGEQPDDRERFDRLVAWVKRHERGLMMAGVALLVIAAGVWFTLEALARRDRFAQQSLQSARFAAESGNLALAANDLSRLISSYGGTRAAEEARLVLGQVQLLQGQADLAAAELATYLEEGPSEEFRIPAYSLYGAALEQTGRFAEAGRAYLEGASGSGYDLLRADLLMEAGRAFTTAGDTAQAVAAYERVLEEFENPPRAPEARLRLAELRRFDVVQ